MKIYQLNGKSYTEDEVIAIHAMWQNIQDIDNIKECIELALAMGVDDEVSEYVRNNEQDITWKLSLNGLYGKMNALARIVCFLIVLLLAS